MTSTLKALRLLSDPHRLRILLLLEAEELSVAELQEILAMSQSTLSTHLGQLKQAGLLEDRRTGKHMLYRLRKRDGMDARRLGTLLELARAAVEEIPEAKQDQQALALTLERRRDRMRAYFDGLAGKFGRIYVPGRSWKALAEMLLQILPPLEIADLGAGEGTLSQLLAQRAVRVIAVDNSDRMVEVGRELAERHGLANLDYRKGEIEEIPISDGSMDLALFSQSLHHAQHPPRAIQEAWRILKPGGKIVILDLRKHQFEQARELYADLWLGFSEVELRGMLEEAGFTAVRSSVVHKEEEAPYLETVLAIGEKPEGGTVQQRRARE